MIVSEIKDENTLIVYWKETDSSIDQTLKRKVEQEVVLKKLREYYPYAKINHTKNGVPLIDGAPFSHISISHRKGWYAFALSQENIGLDIEIRNKNLKNGHHYFLNENEFQFMEQEEQLLLIWSAKEAVYKKYQGEIKDLKNHVTILSIDTLMKRIQADYLEKISLSFYMNNEIILVWTNNA